MSVTPSSPPAFARSSNRSEKPLAWLPKQTGNLLKLALRAIIGSPAAEHWRYASSDNHVTVGTLAATVALALVISSDGHLPVVFAEGQPIAPGMVLGGVGFPSSKVVRTLGVDSLASLLPGVIGAPRDSTHQVPRP